MLQLGAVTSTFSLNSRFGLSHVPRSPAGAHDTTGVSFIPSLDGRFASSTRMSGRQITTPELAERQVCFLAGVRSTARTHPRRSAPGLLSPSAYCREHRKRPAVHFEPQG